MENATANPALANATSPTLSNQSASCRPLEEREAIRAKREANDRNNRGRAWHGFIKQRGDRYRHCTLGNFQPPNDDATKAKHLLIEYCKRINEHIEHGRGLLLFGPAGSGKDHCLIGVAGYAAFNAVLHRKRDFRFDDWSHEFVPTIKWVNGVELFAANADRFNSETSQESIVSRYSRCDVLIISDPLPPSGTLTEARQNILFWLLDERYSNMLPTWVSCNVANRRELEDRMGVQNADRIRHNALAIHFNWQSHRKTINAKGTTSA